MIHEIQYHATDAKNVDTIREWGILLPTSVRVQTHRYKIPSISSADSRENACIYYPGGVVVVLRVKKRARYINRSLRNMRRGENLEDAVNRWLLEAREEGASGVYVGDGLQSTVGNQTLNPRVLKLLDIIPCR